MRRWLGGAQRRAPPEPPDTTDDPLAAIAVAGGRGQRPVYNVSRVNPLFKNLSDSNQTNETIHSNEVAVAPGEKSASSGYSGSHSSLLDQIYHSSRLEETSAVLETNPAFVKSIRIAGRGVKPIKSVPSHNSTSSGTLTTIPEGQIDLIPQPIWPPLDDKKHPYDSLVDEALLLYTSLSYTPDKNKNLESYIDLSVKELLVDLLASIHQTLEGKNQTPEDMLKIVDEKIKTKLHAMKHSTEEEMKKLCVNLSNNKKVNSVLRAFSNSSSSGNSSQTSGRARTTSLETEDIYQIPSGSSSSGFSSDSTKEQITNLPVFVHEDIVSVPNGLRNAMIYGTLYRAKKPNSKDSVKQKKGCLLVDDGKPSVWMQYYGVKAVEGSGAKKVGSPTDVPLYPGGRPEADFTLDLPRSEMLSQRMRDAKRWRCRCRLLASFLGLVFFLLSVMAVSLMLTRGRRMFGSMM